jgi:hypothetical protein
VRSPRLAWGLAAGATYLAAVAITAALAAAPVRLLFDGVVPPQPYNWVSPPPDLAGSNRLPLPGEGSLPFRESGLEAGTVSTGDGQASVVIPSDTFPPRRGQRAVVVSISPEDPARFGAPPPGLILDGNAYTTEARYRPSGELAAPQRTITVILRYPVHATVLLRSSETGWIQLSTNAIPANLQVFGETPELGTFVASAPPQTGPRRWLPLASIGAIVLAAGAGLIARLRNRRRRTPKPAKGSPAQTPRRTSSPPRRAGGGRKLPGRPRGRKRQGR